MAEYIDIARIDDWNDLSIIDDNGCAIYVDNISELPTANVIEIPEGATNGDMITTMFPNAKVQGIEGLEGFQCVAVSIGLGTSYFALDWWDAPYKVESEDNK